MNCSFKEIQPNWYKCVVCGFEIKINQDPNKIFRSCGQGGFAEDPSLLKKATNLVSAVVKHVADGLAIVEPEEQSARLEICKKCEHYTGTHCKLCGCPCNASADVLNKVRWRS